MNSEKLPPIIGSYESAVNSNGYSVFLTVAPSVLLKIISILSDEDISTLIMDGETISSDCLPASA